MKGRNTIKMKYNLISSNILQRVFQLKVGNDRGTGFIVENDGVKYIVTAKHLFKTLLYPKSTKIEVVKENGFDEIENKIFYHQNPVIDIAVIQTSYFNQHSFGVVGYEYDALVSQEMFMLGYPYGGNGECYNINNGYPIPLVKKGILSGNIDKNMKLIMDWDNNHGFSGGPVAYRKYEKNGFSEKEYIAGVISGYILHEIKVTDVNSEKTIGKTKENSGLGTAFNIKYVFEIINSINKN